MFRCQRLDRDRIPQGDPERRPPGRWAVSHQKSCLSDSQALVRRLRRSISVQSPPTIAVRWNTRRRRFMPPELRPPGLSWEPESLPRVVEFSGLGHAAPRASAAAGVRLKANVIALD